MQILLILMACQICSYVLKKIGQPRVIGEMIAGILLGKSVFQLVWPEAFEYFFSEGALSRLYYLSQLGLIFFMFVVGLEFRLSEIKKKAKAAFIISQSSIVIPFLLGSTAAFWLYEPYGPSNIPLLSFCLFMGISMSITAFPVLARILQEKKMTHTSLGTMSIACAAIGDVVAWCLLAAIIGIVKANSIVTAAEIIILLMVYAFIMLMLIKPFIKKLLGGIKTKLSYGHFSLIVCLVLGSAFLTEAIGVHALFGAFVAGSIMPDEISFREELSTKIKDFTSVILLPLFFTFTGIRMQLGLLAEGHSWLICCVIIGIAILGKLIGTAVAARGVGISWPESFSLGILMNTRGLMELIVLNIGYDLGILPPEIFTMLVIMAIVTTVMTSPLLSLTSLISPSKSKN